MTVYAEYAIFMYYVNSTMSAQFRCGTCGDRTLSPICRVSNLRFVNNLGIKARRICGCDSKQSSTLTFRLIVAIQTAIFFKRPNRIQTTPLILSHLSLRSCTTKLIPLTHTPQPSTPPTRISLPQSSLADIMPHYTL